MTKRVLFLLTSIIVAFNVQAYAQLNPQLYWTLLPQPQMDEIVGEASGETAWNTIMETGGYNKNRLAEEYAGTFYEAQYIYDQLRQYGVPGAEIVRFPGREVWDGIKGELWETNPMRQKIASYKDMTAMLAKGSNPADVITELIWVGNGTKKELEGLEIAGKIVVTEGSLNSVHNLACLQDSAAGVVVISTSRLYVDPLQIPWSSIRGRGEEKPAKFAFFLPYREGYYLKRRLLRGEKITVHAQVESKMEPAELQDVVCLIPGTNTNADEVIFSAHLFEGFTKQGANDNKSGSAAILEVARLLYTLIQEGRLNPPKRGIRFLWGPEFSGTGPWVKANKDIMKRTLFNINMDMVGEWLSKSQSFMTMARTSYGNPHYSNDVMENYFRYVGEGSREIYLYRSPYRVPRRIVAPSGADEPFYWRVEPHSGGSDHLVFCDWGVQVPGISLCAWPDTWYHTSGDRIDKADPTQLRRVAAIGAAVAYTVANADDNMATKIAGETTSNGTRRLGHQFVVGLEKINNAVDTTFTDSYKMARVYVETAVKNEIATLETIMELATDKKMVSDYLKTMKKTINQIGSAHLQALDKHMKAAAVRLNVKPAKIKFSDLEKKAAKIIPRPTAKVTMNGYQGYREFINEVPKEERDKYPYSRRSIGSTAELQLLIDGKRSVLDIKNMLDAQYPRVSELQSVINYIEILKLAGLIVM